MSPVVLASVLVLLGIGVQDPIPGRISSAREMVKQRRYQDAVNTLEDILDKRPGQADALSLLAASNMYTSGDFVRALGSFEEAIKSGGYAIFWVSHSHEKIGTSDLADYCRGWLYIRANEIEFAPDNSDHGFRLAYPEVKEFVQNKLMKKLFHIKDSNKTYTFRPRSGEESEVLLILSLYKRRSK